MRDALSIFDQAASFCQGNITYQKVIEDLNVLDSENYFRIVELSLENKVPEVMVLLNDIIGKGFDGGLLVQGLAKHVRNVMMAKDPQTLPLLEVSEQQKQRYQEQAKKAPTPFLYGALRLMNQCDLGYRQSSNKRLLVELTLIEVAQLTQPEDAPASGRKPRRLKSLFKNLMAPLSSQQGGRPSTQPEVKTAPQVAAAANTTTTGRPVATGAAKQTAHPSGSPRLAGIISSWGNLRRQAQPNRKQILPDLQADDDEQQQASEEFKQEELELQWMAMCNRMPQHYSAIAARMKNMNPVITSMPAVEVVVPNDIIKAEVESIKGSIVNTLKKHLHHSGITVTLRVAAPEERQKILTRREQFELMSSKNPSIEKLREAFDLSLA